MIDFFLLTAAVCLLTVTPFLIQLLRSYARWTDYRTNFWKSTQMEVQMEQRAKQIDCI